MLLHYRPVEKIGEGGMGVVWKAIDTTLDREVAVKVLPEALTGDPLRLARFEREAKLLATLSHPNIAAVYGLHETDGVRFIAMELVPGEDLAERLARGALPVDEAVDVARQIAEALAAAHENGVIHRDLKPANVKRTEDGTVKVLDFGLAKAFSAEAPEGDPALSPTLTSTYTQAGVILGTAAYMSPEQARGRPIDRRTDAWSFGCVLFECLTGRKAFEGETISDTLASILKTEPDWSALPAALPTSVRRLLRRCLEKDVRRRLRHLGDAALELADPEDRLEEKVARTAHRRGIPWPWIAAFASLLALAAIVWGLTVRPASAPPPRFTQLTFERGTVTGASFASDGQTVVYSAAWGEDSPRVFLRRLDSYDPLALDLGAASVLDASPEGQIALLVPGASGTTGRDIRLGMLAVTTITGGGLRRLADDVLAAAFAPQGADLAVARQRGAEVTIEYPVGNVLAQFPGQSYHVAVSPDGNRVAFVDGPILRDTRGRIAVVDREGRVSHLTESWESVGGLAWVPGSDSLLFTASRGDQPDRLYSVAADGRLECLLSAPDSLVLHDVSSDGRLLVGSLNRRVETWVEGPAGRREFTIRGFSFPFHVSNTGRLVAMSVAHGSADYDAFVQPTDGTAPIHLGMGEARSISPDGRWVVGTLPRPRAPLMLWPTGAGENRRLNLDLSVSGVCWHPDGETLVVAGAERGAKHFLWRVDPDSGERSRISPVPVHVDAVLRMYVAPDGSTIAALDDDDALQLFPLSGDDPRPVPGWLPGDLLAGWGLDGALYVAESSGPRVRVVRLDPGDGSREAWREISPDDPSGLTGIVAVEATPDGTVLVYAVFRDLSNLFVVENSQR
jgi:Tol biopolymer transport system component